MEYVSFFGIGSVVLKKEITIFVVDSTLSLLKLERTLFERILALQILFLRFSMLNAVFSLNQQNDKQKDYRKPAIRRTKRNTYGLLDAMV